MKGRGLARGCGYYREERVCGQHGSVTVLEHDRVPLRDRPSSMGHPQAEPTGSEPSLNVRFRAGKGADSCEQATALRFARTERARAWLHGARSCRLRICGAARVMFAPTDRACVLLHASIVAVAGMRRTWNREMRSVNRLGQPCTWWISMTCAHPSQQWNTCTPLSTCGSVSTEGTAHARVSLVSMVNLRVNLFAVYLRSPPASSKKATRATACNGVDGASPL